MTDLRINFRDIPKTSRLFQDYLNDFEKLGAFYPPGGISFETLVEHARQVLSKESPRVKVAEILRDQNVQAGATAATLANIDRLGQHDSVVIVTGQQAGLFTGPLFTIFKALTAVKVSQQLVERGINAVPVFWVAAEDHDFEEVNHVAMIDREGNLQKLVYTGSTGNEGQPVGQIALNSSIEESVRDLFALLPESEFIQPLKDELAECYRADTGFAKAFARLLTRLIGRFGIVLIDPLDGRLKEIAGTIYRRAMTQLPEFSANLVRQSAALEAAGYHAQVHTGPEVVPLFILEDGRRRAMILDADGRLRFKGRSESYDFASIVAKVETNPADFSPNVTLRPIVQDYLLPTAAIIGGAAEIAYFAQLRPNYELLGRLAPLFLPRASLTLIEKRYARTMSRLNIDFTDLFEGGEALLRKVVEGNLDHSTAEVFDETERLINEQLERLRQSLHNVDPTLAEALRGGREKILYQIHNLRTRFVHNRARHDEVIRHQIDRLATALYPHRKLQERELNILYFLARYGHTVIDQIYEALDPRDPQHRLVLL